MNLKVFTLFSAILFACNITLAQDYAFKVLGSKGNPTSNGAVLKVGSKIMPTQLIVLGEGASLDLATPANKVVNLSKAGSYKAQDLVAQASSQKNLTNDYAKYVISELTSDNDNAVTAKNKFNHMNKTGSVKRATGMVVAMLPEKSKIYGNSIVLKWFVKDNLTLTEPIDRYKVELQNMEDKVLFSKEVTETNLTIDLNKEKISETIMICRIYPIGKNGNSLETAIVDGNMLVKTEDLEAREISAELVNISKSQNSSSLSKLIEARFFEEKELYADAITSYEEALKLSESTEQYKRIYNLFLDRNGLSKEAMAAAAESKE